MSVVIIGGNERMACLYEDICKNYGCSAKVFAKEKGALKKKIGCPDLLILFTNTVSQRMVNSAVEEAKRNNIEKNDNPKRLKREKKQILIII